MLVALGTVPLVLQIYQEHISIKKLYLDVACQSIYDVITAV